MQGSGARQSISPRGRNWTTDAVKVGGSIDLLSARWLTGHADPHSKEAQSERQHTDRSNFVGTLEAR